MDVQYYGGNCVKISSKKFSIVVDDNLQALGAKSVTKSTDISLRTSTLTPEHSEALFSAEMPGEYEISGAIIRGTAARAHMDEEGQHSAVIYTIEAEEARIGVIGHIFPQLSEDQLENIGLLDIVIIPVGGNGYTLDGVGALSIIKQIEPKFVIPTHYADKDLKYEVPQQELSEAIKGLGMEPSETTSKYKVRPGEPADTTKLVILERQ
ncbi:MAG TPA: MBL fold metallo-hydrolase [Candidatus Saccharimonadales bacterium]|nr:MBL fold metallo-hydrolase [Candidatus Saccharimonadales bacterium]